MADHGNPEYAVADGNDYPSHEHTYEFFIALMKWGTISVIVIVIGLGFLTL